MRVPSSGIARCRRHIDWLPPIDITAGSAGAGAITLDDPFQTVVRPDSGSITVDLTGTVTLDFQFIDTFVDNPVTAGGDSLTALATTNLSGILFQVTVNATDPLHTPFSVNVIDGDRPVPEPATLSLVGAGLALAAMRRRRR